MPNQAKENARQIAYRVLTERATLLTKQMELEPDAEQRARINSELNKIDQERTRYVTPIDPDDEEDK